MGDGEEVGISSDTFREQCYTKAAMGWPQYLFWLVVSFLFYLFEKYVLPASPVGGWGASLLNLGESFILILLFSYLIDEVCLYFGKFAIEEPTNGKDASAGQSSPSSRV